MNTKYLDDFLTPQSPGIVEYRTGRGDGRKLLGCYNGKHMKWSHSAKLFGIRFGLCLVLIGAAYVAIFGLHPVIKPAPASSQQKLASLRAALDETYIAGTALANFKQSDATAFESLDNSRSQFETATKRLQTALLTAPPAKMALYSSDLNTIVARAQQATESYQASNSVLTQIISYNPSVDMGQLSSQTELAKIAARASAAQKGLQKVADNQTAGAMGLSVQGENGPALLVFEQTRAALRGEAACFEQLSLQAGAGHRAAAELSRDQCLHDYPALRLLAIQNVTQNSWGGDYQATTQRVIPPLLGSLDQLIKN